MSDDDSFDEQSSNDGNNSEPDLEEEDKENSSDPDEMELDLPTTSESNEERSFECNDCGRKFSLLSSLESHINSWHTDEQSKKGKKCPICKKIITSSYFDQHVRDTHSDEKPFKCEECGMSFKRKTSMARHIKDQHSTVNLVRCQICHKSYPKNYMKEHMQMHNDEKSYNCSECGKSFNTKSGVYNHKLHTHRIGYDAEKLKRNCPICDKVLANQASLSGHMKTHEGLRPHKCTECNQNFATKSSLKEHVSRLHNAEEKYKCTCDQCGKVLKGKGNLKKHMRIHSAVDELPTFECDICHKRFREKNYLARHQRIHDGGNNYFCQYCDQAFRERQTWINHERKHTEKPEQCDVCLKIFASHLALLSHKKFVHGEETCCDCPICCRWLKPRNNNSNEHEVPSDGDLTTEDEEDDEDCAATQ